jgi:hypothetical protein
LGFLSTLVFLLGYFIEKSQPVELSPTGPPVAKQFILFDGTLYKNKPDMSMFGIKPIRILYEGELWDQGQSRAVLPTQDRVRTIALGAKDIRVPVAVDIEGWPTSPTVHKVSTAAAQESIEKLTTVLRWFHEAAPDTPIGLYGIVPIIDYWRAIQEPATAEHRSWVADNDRARPLVGSVDVVFPSLYTFYTDREGWVKVAIAQMAEARRVAGGKPVYVFLWPQYHNSNHLLGMTYLPADYWKLELETARQYADGAVIWGGWGNDDRQAEWEDQAAWWQVTKQFLTQVDTVAPAKPRDLRVQ